MKGAIGGMGEIAHVKPPVIPVLHCPNDEWLVDSTPMIDKLDPILGGERSIIPPDPTNRFLSYLFEDLADEWSTKAMFWFRWKDQFDARIFSLEGAYNVLGAVGKDRLEAVADQFCRRQIGRMAIVGCTETNAPIIEETLDELVVALGNSVTKQAYLFGSRPSRADFAIYGQLKQLCSESTPSLRIRKLSPLAHAWVTMTDDLSAVEGKWNASGDRTPLVEVLLRICAEVYLPFLEANERALQAGETGFSVKLRTTQFSQPAYRYQQKCLRWLREKYHLELE